MSEQLVSGGPATRALAHIWDSWSKYAPLIGTIKHIGITNIPDDWVPWLIWDQGLEDIVPYVRDMRQALAEGPAWLRTRGTPAGISTGISFVQSAGIVAASDQRHQWWEFQVAFEQPPSDVAQIQQLDGIIRLSKASEDELFRMYSPGADFRPVRMDMHRMDDGLMDAYSGVRLWDGGPLISFGWANSIATDFGASAIEGVEVTVSIDLSWFDGMRFDQDRMGTRPESLTAYSAELDVSTDTYAFAADSWPVVWPTSWEAAAEPATLTTSWEIL
jgi:hypothetical protein